MNKHPLIRHLLNGLTFGAVIGVGLYLFHSPAEYTLREHLFSLLTAAIMALLSGLVLGLIFYCIETVQARKFDAFRASLKAEGELILEEKASRLCNGVQYRGRLFLTDRTLVFRPSSEREVGCTILRNAISAVQITDPRRCHIAVIEENGAEETFVVVDPRGWFDLLGKEDKPEKTEENL